MSDLTKTEQRRADIGSNVQYIANALLTFVFDLVVDWARDNVDRLPELLDIARKAALEKAQKAGEWVSDSLEDVTGLDLDGDGVVGDGN